MLFEVVIAPNSPVSYTALGAAIGFLYGSISTLLFLFLLTTVYFWHIHTL